MVFGQQSGPPASHSQVAALLELLQNDGHTDFRDARGPMGFTQRQAGGKFTRDEAQQFIDQLEEAEDQRLEAAKGQKPVQANKGQKPAAAAKQSAPDPLLGDLPSEQLAAELRRRGFKVSR